MTRNDLIEGFRKWREAARAGGWTDTGSSATPEADADLLLKFMGREPIPFDGRLADGLGSEGMRKLVNNIPVAARDGLKVMDNSDLHAGSFFFPNTNGAQ